MNKRWLPVTEWIGFQLVWLASALGAAQGWNAPGLIAAVLFVGAVHTIRGWSASEHLVILASGATGLIAESALVSMELVRFAAPWPSLYLAPLWIVALWMAFGATLSAVSTLIGRYLLVKASFIGLISGPLAYWAGARLGALEIIGSAFRTYLAIALIWAIALPFLLMVRRRMER